MSAREYVCTFVNGELVPMQELVRCRDCKHSDDGGHSCERFEHYEPIPGWDDYELVSEEVRPDDFCAWGIRKEDA